MMKCDKVSDLLPGYIEGALKPRKENQVAEHLAGCPRCKREEMELRRTIELASSLEMEYPSEERWNQFMTDLHRRIEEEMLIQSLRKPGFARFLPAVGFAALTLSIFLMMVTIGIKLSPMLVGPPRSGETAPIQQADIRPYLSVLIDKAQVKQIERMAVPAEEETQSYIYVGSGEIDTSVTFKGGMRPANGDKMDALIEPELIGPPDYGEIGYETGLVLAGMKE
ncbi:TPA: hypothetical protein EYP37_10290 [Candidatus Poribacteria bacterium]|nr:hypothetical protein [Candidatus Poribacteria bacterium]